MKINYYDVLGVDRFASEQEIRDRFRQLARTTHPDRIKGTDKSEAERKFQNLTEAVNILTNPVQREPLNTTYLKDDRLICKQAGLVAKAERYLNEALKWDPTNFEIQTALADLRQGKGVTASKKG